MFWITSTVERKIWFSLSFVTYKKHKNSLREMEGHSLFFDGTTQQYIKMSLNLSA